MEIFTENYEKEYKEKKEERIEKNSKSTQSFFTNLQKLDYENRIADEKKFQEKMEKYQKIV